MVTSYPAISYPMHYTHTLSQEHASVSARTSISVLGNNVEHTMITVARAAADASNCLFLAAYVETGTLTALGVTRNQVFRLYAATTQIATVTGNVELQPFYMQAFRLPATTSSVDYKITVAQDWSGNTSSASCILGLIEVTF